MRGIGKWKEEGRRVEGGGEEEERLYSEGLRGIGICRDRVRVGCTMIGSSRSTRQRRGGGYKITSRLRV